MKDKKISAFELFKLLPDGELDGLSQSTGVDYQAKKLHGKTVLQLLLYGLLSGKELSWRILEVLAESKRFQRLADLPVRFETDHSSLAERASHIKIDYFKAVFERVGVLMEQRCVPQAVASYKLVRCDSTFVNIAASLLKIGGMDAGVNTKKKKENHPVAVKFSVGFNGVRAKDAKFFHTPSHKSDDVSLRELIGEGDWDDKEIAVFDRGLQSRGAFDEFSDNHIKFVTRLKRGSKGTVKYKKMGEVTQIPEGQPIITDTLIIEQDLKVILYGKTGRKTNNTYRLIIAVIIESGEEIFFLTNITEQLTAQQITEIYRRRWDIEVFFKFLKQEFNFKHLLSRNENGIQVVLYTTLIAATLIFVYRHLNKIEGFKIAKLHFINDLEIEIMKKVVVICQGKPELVDYFTIW
jgi:Transposase DDE domain